MDFNQKDMYKSTHSFSINPPWKVFTKLCIKMHNDPFMKIINEPR